MSFKQHFLSNMGQLFTSKLYGKNWPAAHPIGKLNDIVIPLNSQCMNGLYTCKYSVLPSTRYEPIRVRLQDVEVLVIYGIKIYVWGCIQQNRHGGRPQWVVRQTMAILLYYIQWRNRLLFRNLSIFTMVRIYLFFNKCNKSTGNS